MKPAYPDQKDAFFLTHPYTPAVETRYENRQALLNILEIEETVTRASLAAASGLGVMTVQRAVRLLMLEGILREKRLPNPRNGRMSWVLSPAPLPPAVVLDLSSRPYTARLVSSTCFHGAEGLNDAPASSVCVEARDTFSGEENLRLLLSRVRRTLYPLLPGPPRAAGIHDSGLPGRGIRPVLLLPAVAVADAARPGRTAGITPPTLLFPGAGPRSLAESTAQLTAVIREELDHPTLPGWGDVSVVGDILVTDMHTAARYALTHSPTTADCFSLLCVLDRDVPDIFFLLRDRDSRYGCHRSCSCTCSHRKNGAPSSWFTPTCLAPMENQLASALRSSSNGGNWRPLLDLMTAWDQLIHLNGIYLGKDVLPPEILQKLPSVLPEGCCLLPNVYTPSLPLPVIGAAMLSRRQTWNDMDSCGHTPENF